MLWFRELRFLAVTVLPRTSAGKISRQTRSLELRCQQLKLEGAFLYMAENKSGFSSTYKEQGKIISSGCRLKRKTSQRPSLAPLGLG